MATCASFITFGMADDGTTMRFSSYGVAMTEPSFARSFDCWLNAFSVSVPDMSSNSLTPPLTLAPARPVAGMSRPAKSRPSAIEVATNAPRRLRTEPIAER